MYFARENFAKSAENSFSSLLLHLYLSNIKFRNFCSRAEIPIFSNFENSNFASSQAEDGFVPVSQQHQRERRPSVASMAPSEITTLSDGGVTSRVGHRQRDDTTSQFNFQHQVRLLLLIL